MCDSAPLGESSFRLSNIGSIQIDILRLKPEGLIRTIRGAERYPDPGSIGKVIGLGGTGIFANPSLEADMGLNSVSRPERLGVASVNPPDLRRGSGDASEIHT